MPSLNFHHLHHFWTVAREGSIANASRAHKVSPPTISTQIKALEIALGDPLFHRRARRMDLTAFGQSVFKYADQIFNLGNELVSSVQNGEISQKRKRIVVGVTDSLPKLIVHAILQPVINPDGSRRVVCRVGTIDALVLDLASGRLDLVISDEPAPTSTVLKVFSHKLGESGISFCATPQLAEQLKPRFPQSLENAPLLVPSDHHALRRNLDQWFARLRVQPRIIAEFQDPALAKYFAAEGSGIFAVPAVVSELSSQLFKLDLVGHCDDCHENYYLISAEHTLTQPTALMLTEHARSTIFRNSSSV